VNWKLGIVWIGALLAGRDLGEAAGNTTIRVFVFDYAGVSDGVLKGATIAAAAAMEPTGIHLEWVECAIRTEMAPEESPCKGYVPIDIQLRILDARMGRRMGTTRACLGYAVIASGSVAAVYHHRATELESEGVASLQAILGGAMAHEIAHLLLAEPGHSPAGLMRATWDKADLKALGQGRLTLSESQAQRIALMAAKRAQERSQGAAGTLAASR
jgi:hypothetical protein